MTNETRVFLDANVLAKPVTRTLLMAGGPASRFHSVWSQASEAEAIRHMRPRAISPTALRERMELLLSPSGTVGDRFRATPRADRQILADAEASGSKFLITEDVDDFAEDDLHSIGLSAVNPDLFLATQLTRKAYISVIEIFVRSQVRPPTTAAEFHQAVARNHPRLFAAHADLFKVSPAASLHAPPAVLLRGRRCISCTLVALSNAKRCIECGWSS